MPIPVPSNAEKYGPYFSLIRAQAELASAREHGLVVPNGLEGGLCTWFFYAWKPMACLPEAVMFDQFVTDVRTLIADAGKKNYISLVKDSGKILLDAGDLLNSLSGTNTVECPIDRKETACQTFMECSEHIAKNEQHTEGVHASPFSGVLIQLAINAVIEMLQKYVASIIPPAPAT